MSQYAALWNLSREAELTNAELARRSFVTAQSMIQVVKGLDRNGWITRRADPEHGRQLLSIITEAGLERTALASAVVEDLEAEMSDGVSGAACDALRSTLGVFAANLEGGDSPAR